MTPVDLQHVTGGDLEPTPFLSLGRGARLPLRDCGDSPRPSLGPTFPGNQMGLR